MGTRLSRFFPFHWCTPHANVLTRSRSESIRCFSYHPKSLELYLFKASRIIQSHCDDEWVQRTISGFQDRINHRRIMSESIHNSGVCLLQCEIRELQFVAPVCTRVVGENGCSLVGKQRYGIYLIYEFRDWSFVGSLLLLILNLLTRTN